jgi:hypothetical protein
MPGKGQILTAINFGNDPGQLDVHPDGCCPLYGVGKFGQVSVNMIIVERLRKPHQRGHLAVQNVHSPPDLAAPLDHVFSQIFDRHLCVHALCHRHSHCLSDLERRFVSWIENLVGLVDLHSYARRIGYPKLAGKARCSIEFPSIL